MNATECMCAQVCVVVVAICGRLTIAQTDRPLNDLDEARIRASWPALSSKRIAQIAPAMTKIETQRYVDILSLSDAQARYLDSLFENYRGQLARIEGNDGAALNETIEVIASRNQPGIASRNQPGIDSDYLDAQLAMFEWTRRFSNDVARQDEQLFVELERVLSEEQRQKMVRIRLHRERYRCVLAFRNIKSSKARVDLGRWLDTGRFGGPIAPEIDSVLSNYEREITPLKVQLEQLSHRFNELTARIDIQIHLAQSTEANNDRQVHGPTAAVASLQQSLNGILRQSLSLQRRIGKLNDQYLAQLSNLLVEPHAAEFSTLYKQRAYSRVFPDRADPIEIYRGLVNGDDIDESTKQLLKDVWDSYRDAYDAICILMCAETTRWQEAGALADWPDGWQEHHDQMLRWSEDRVRLNEQMVRRLCENIPPEVVESKREVLDQWRADLARVREGLAKRQQQRAIDFS